LAPIQTGVGGNESHLMNSLKREQCL